MARALPLAASRLAASRPPGSCGWQEYRAKARGRSPIATRKARREDTRRDLVHREFHAAGITPSTGTVGDSYDNALAENVNGSYKNELINNHRCKDVLEVEIATFEWVTWWNHTRLHQALDYRTPVEVDNDYWPIASTSEKMKTRANA